MRKYEDEDVEVVTKRQCVYFSCDMCGVESKCPAAEAFDYGNVGISTGELKSSYTIDGEYAEEALDLCKDCADSLIDQIRGGVIKCQR